MFATSFGCGRSPPDRARWPEVRIALDLTVAGTRGGISSYALQLLRALGRVGSSHELLAWCGSPAAAAAVSPIAPSNSALFVPPVAIQWLGAWGRVARLNLLSIERLVGSADLFHGLNYLLPAQRGKAVRVITLHDLSALRDPEWHPWYRSLLHRAALRRTTGLVDHVITDSEAVRSEVIDYFGLLPARVSAVHLAAAEHFRPHEAAEIKSILDRYQLIPGEYLCYVGALEPRKNLIGLLNAITAIRKRRPDFPPLVLVGPFGWRNSAIRARLTEPGVRYLGYLTGEDAAGVVAGAMGFTYPSLYEGFGLPVLEALACGTPVVTSNEGALVEVAGDCAVLVDPRSPEAIAEGIVKLVDDSALRAELRRRGLERARRFSWDRAATETLTVYEHCLAR